MQAAHVAEIGGAKEAKDFGRLVVGAEQDDGPVIRFSEPLIDAFGQALHGVVQFAVALDLGAARRRQLGEAEAAAELRVALQQQLDGQQSLLDALGVVQAIDADAEQRVAASSRNRARPGRGILPDWAPSSTQRTGHSSEIG